MRPFERNSDYVYSLHHRLSMGFGILLGWCYWRLAFTILLNFPWMLNMSSRLPSVWVLDRSKYEKKMNALRMCHCGRLQIVHTALFETEGASWTVRMFSGSACQLHLFVSILPNDNKHPIFKWQCGRNIEPPLCSSEAPPCKKRSGVACSEIFCHNLASMSLALSICP